MRLKLNQYWAGRNKPVAWLLTSGLLAAGAVTLNLPSEATSSVFWPVQSIDTVKYSRDLSREKLNDPSFDNIIEQQVAAIAATGATHVAIGTPYDEEFWPFLERWISAARRHNLNIWFRGNWSGWEGWFGYAVIDRATHIRKTGELIHQHPQWFADGDIFTACPECENGGPGDPRQTGDTTGHRKFLIDEYRVTRQAFAKNKKAVQSNFNSMNGDVARLIMDRETTTALGGIITVDHYVATPQQLAHDVSALAEQSGGRVVLGEFGAPIVDIHGPMTNQQQSRWLAEALQELARIPSLIGVNYWTGTGGPTQLWDSAGQARPAVAVLASYFKPAEISGVVMDELGRSLAGVSVQDAYRRTETNRHGVWQLPYLQHETSHIDFSATGYADQQLQIGTPQKDITVTLIKLDKSLAFRLFQTFQAHLNRWLI